MELLVVLLALGLAVYVRYLHYRLDVVTDQHDEMFDTLVAIANRKARVIRTATGVTVKWNTEDTEE